MIQRKWHLTCAFTASLRRAKLLNSERYTYKDVTMKQGTCISEIKPSNGIVGLGKHNGYEEGKAHT